MAAAKVLSTLDSPLQFIAYAGGYASGTMLGSNIERWLAVGKVVLRIIVPVSAPDVQEAMRKPDTTSPPSTPRAATAR